MAAGDKLEVVEVENGFLLRSLSAAGGEPRLWVALDPSVIGGIASAWAQGQNINSVRGIPLSLSGFELPDDTKGSG